ncbi:MAG: hypothetical protein H0V82_00645 [Candidatus Protochlamydia sp.]|nr:hypothetical protein [Candidatus Protochlamydia sp.]
MLPTNSGIINQVGQDVQIRTNNNHGIAEAAANFSGGLVAHTQGIITGFSDLLDTYKVANKMSLEHLDRTFKDISQILNKAADTSFELIQSGRDLSQIEKLIDLSQKIVTLTIDNKFTNFAKIYDETRMVIDDSSIMQFELIHQAIEIRGRLIFQQADIENILLQRQETLEKMERESIAFENEEKRFQEKLEHGFKMEDEKMKHTKEMDILQIKYLETLFENAIKLYEQEVRAADGIVASSQEKVTVSKTAPRMENGEVIFGKVDIVKEGRPIIQEVIQQHHHHQVTQQHIHRHPPRRHIRHGKH